MTVLGRLSSKKCSRGDPLQAPEGHTYRSTGKRLIKPTSISRFQTRQRRNQGGKSPKKRPETVHKPNHPYPRHTGDPRALKRKASAARHRFCNRSTGFKWNTDWVRYFQDSKPKSCFIADDTVETYLATGQLDNLL